MRIGDASGRLIVMLNYSNLGAAPSCRQDPFGQEDPFGRIREENTRTEQQESDVVGITHTTLTRIMTQKKWGELIQLYSFYANTTKRQKTQQVWCTTSFAAKGCEWDEKKVKRVKKRLIEMGLIEDVKPVRRPDGTLGKPYIRVRFIANPTSGGETPPPGELDPQMLTDSKGNAVERRSKESKETPPDGDDGFEAVWIPDNRTKEEKLRAIKPPKRFPTERQFDQFIYDYELDEIVNKRSSLYWDLCNRKWHHWNERDRKWTPIRNWQEYVTALNQKIADVF